MYKINCNKNKQPISIRLQLYSKINGANKLYTDTVKIPQGMSKREANTFAKEQELLFKQALKNGYLKIRFYEDYLNGINNPQAVKVEPLTQSDPTFSFVAEKWLNRVKQNKSKAYYKRARDTLLYFMPIFGDMPIKAIISAQLKDTLYDLQGKNVTTIFYRFKIDLNAEIARLGLEKQEFCAQCGISMQTLRKLNNGLKIQIKTVKKVCEYLQLDIDSCTEKDITEHGKIQPATVSSYRRILSCVFADAVEYGYISDNPLVKVKIEKSNPLQRVTKDSVLTPSEAKALEKYMIARKNISNNAELVRAIAVLLPMYTGLRQGEVNGLKWSDIDFTNKVIHVRAARQYLSGYGTFEKGTKTVDSTRDIPIPLNLMELLTEYKAWYDYQTENIWGDLRTTDYLLLNDTAQPYSVGTPYRWLKEALKACGLKAVNYHSLRHFYISALIMKGIPITTVSHLAGHKNSQVTMTIYAHWFAAVDNRAAEAINNVFSDSED